MIVKSDYKTKFEALASFLEVLCRGIKKEIKQEFIQKGLLRKSDNAGDWKEISQFFYKKTVEEGDEKTGEWLAACWVCKNGEIFQCFHEELSLINKNYDQLVEIPSEKEEKIKNLSIEKFGFIRTYLFSVLNAVVFSPKIFNDLQKGALVELASDKESGSEEKACSVEELKKAFEVEKMKIEEKHEKRLQGVMKKYQMEVEGYRKQISQLQKRLEKA